MKTIRFTQVLGIISVSFQSCLPVYQVSSGSTESYIKNFVEKHKEGESSSIKICQIFKGPALNGGLLELTGYKYGSSKSLVIAASESYAPPAKSQPQQAATIRKETVYVRLTSDQVKSIIDNYQILEAKIKGEQPVANETVYHDFTASSDLFVSYSRSAISFGNQATNFLHLWVNGNKFTISSAEIIKKMDAFLKY